MTGAQAVGVGGRRHRPRTHLLVVYAPTSYGRTTAAATMAFELAAAGDRVEIVGTVADARPLSASPARFEPVPPDRARFFGLAVQAAIDALRPDSVVLFDVQSVARALAVGHVRLGMPNAGRLFGLDTWVSRRSGARIDLFCDVEEAVPPVPEELLRLVPVPIGLPGDDGAVSLVAPTAVRSQQAVVRRRRSARRPTILLATAPWQHQEFGRDDARAVQVAVPATIAAAVRAVAGAQLVHVGPAPLEPLDDLGGRYRFIGTVAADRMGHLLTTADAFIALTPGAITIAHALARGVPVVRVHAPLPATAVEPVPARHGDPGVSIAGYPFEVWPLGYARFLRPVLEVDPFAGSVAAVDARDSASVREAIGTATEPGPGRERLVVGAAALSATLERLPSPADVVAAGGF